MSPSREYQKQFLYASGKNGVIGKGKYIKWSNKRKCTEHHCCVQNK